MFESNLFELEAKGLQIGIWLRGSGLKIAE